MLRGMPNKSGDTFQFDLTTCTTNDVCTFTTGPWVGAKGPNCQVGADTVIINGDDYNNTITYYISTGISPCNLTSIQVSGGNVIFTFAYDTSAPYNIFDGVTVQGSQINVASEIFNANTLNITNTKLNVLSSSNITAVLLSQSGSTIQLTNTTNLGLSDGSIVESSTITAVDGSTININMATVTFNNSQITGQGLITETSASNLVLLNTSLEVAQLSTIGEDIPVVITIGSTSTITIAQNPPTLKLAIQGQNTQLNLVSSGGQPYSSLVFSSLFVSSGSSFILDGKITNLITVESLQVDGQLLIDSISGDVILVGPSFVQGQGLISISNVSSPISLGLFGVRNISIVSVSSLILNNVNFATANFSSIGTITQYNATFIDALQVTNVNEYYSYESVYSTTNTLYFDSVNISQIQSLSGRRHMNNLVVSNATYISLYDMYTLGNFTFSNVDVVNLTMVVVYGFTIESGPTNITLNTSLIGDLENQSPSSQVYLILEDGSNFLVSGLALPNVTIISGSQDEDIKFCSLTVNGNILYQQNELVLDSCTLTFETGANFTFANGDTSILQLTNSRLNVISTEFVVGQINIGNGSNVNLLGSSNITTGSLSLTLSNLTLNPYGYYNFEIINFTAIDSLIQSTSYAELNTKNFNLEGSTINITQPYLNLLPGQSLFNAQNSAILVTGPQSSHPSIASSTFIIGNHSSINVVFTPANPLLSNSSYTILFSTSNPTNTNNIVIDDTVTTQIEGTGVDPKLVTAKFNVSSNSFDVTFNDNGNGGGKGSELKPWQIALIVIGVLTVLVVVVGFIVYRHRKHHHHHHHHHGEHSPLIR